MKPVRFPPGRAKLATNPEPTGSTLPTNTTGMVPVSSACSRSAAFLAYRTGIIKCSYGVSGHMTYGTEVSGFGLLG
jgi:hypothetical protein